MSGGAWSKFFWNDWRGDPALRLCSLAAQGLWMQMLCIAAESDPKGYVSVNGRTLTTTDLAKLTGAPEAVIQSAHAELDLHGVFSRDRHGRIYCRRMVRDAKLAKIHRKNGQTGGNPALLQDTEYIEKKCRGLTPRIRGGLSPISQKPEARKEKDLLTEVQKESSPSGAETAVANGGAKPRKARWPPDRIVPDDWIAEAAALSPSPDGYAEAERFQAYWTEGKGRMTARDEHGWHRTWQNWLAKARPGPPNWRDRYGWQPWMSDRAIGLDAAP